MAKKYKTNVNYHINVKLTNYGKELIIKDCGYDYFEKCVEINKQPDGYYSFQLWDLMQLLGRYCFNGCNLPFETAVYFNEHEIEVEEC